MTDRTESRVLNEPNCGLKKIVVRTGTTVEAGTDTVTLTLADFGCDRVLACYGVYQATEDSIMLQEDDFTTDVTSGLLTITTVDVGGNDSTDNNNRVYTVWAESGA